MDYSHRPKMAPHIHTSPEYKELRKTYQGINATTKGSVAKSIRRHTSKTAKSKALEKSKH